MNQLLIRISSFNPNNSPVRQELLLASVDRRRKEAGKASRIGSRPRSRAGIQTQVCESKAHDLSFYGYPLPTEQDVRRPSLPIGTASSERLWLKWTVCSTHSHKPPNITTRDTTTAVFWGLLFFLGCSRS